MTNKQILVVVAFYLEAKQIISHFGLKKVCKKPFEIFENRKITLVLSGLGSDNSKKAVEFAYNSHEMVYNFGICAAKKKFEIGKLCRLSDGFSITSVNLPVMSVDDFETDLCDMESSGFYSATKNLDCKIDVYKVVSDYANPNIDKKFYLDIIGDKFVKVLKDYLS